MARCEVAVRANLSFHTRGFEARPWEEPGKRVTIRFDGRDFVWHPNNEPGPEGQEWWPGVTVAVADFENYDVETEAMNRFLSALAFAYDQPVDVLMYGGSSQTNPEAPPTPHYPRRGLGDHVHPAPKEVAVKKDDVLQLSLGLYREGLNTESPFYRFLSFMSGAAMASTDMASRVTVVAEDDDRLAGYYASIQVRVRPRGVVCRIRVFYKTTKSEAKGLGPRRPKTGTVTWRWKVGTNTTPGQWSIEIDCGEAGKAKARIRVRR